MDHNILYETEMISGNKLHLLPSTVDKIRNLQTGNNIHNFALQQALCEVDENCEFDFCYKRNNKCISKTFKNRESEIETLLNSSKYM